MALELEEVVVAVGVADIAAGEAAADNVAFAAAAAVAVSVADKEAGLQDKHFPRWEQQEQGLGMPQEVPQTDRTILVLQEQLGREQPVQHRGLLVAETGPVHCCTAQQEEAVAVGGAG